jgi:hypothetical protein
MAKGSETIAWQGLTSITLYYDYDQDRIRPINKMASYKYYLWPKLHIFDRKWPIISSIHGQNQ